ncbi:MAG: rod shape-determining protein MreC [Alistipes sp.]|nr:rod shape-determining protein MreC [Alistipes sp.]MBQ8438316.1 rod shape-determining protein MreC [Alistipes sp.]
MYKLIEFIRRIYVVLLFILIEAIALNYYAHSSFYTRAKILAHANSLTGAFQQSIFSLRHYFTLRSENEMLATRVAELENTLSFYREREAQQQTDTLTMVAMDSTLLASMSQYRYMTARVISNTVNSTQNFITINRGRQHGVMGDMAVVTPDGAMVGSVVECSERYSVVMPVLHTSFRTSGKIAGDEHFGSISWDGTSPHRVQMSELTKYSDFEIGAEVVSSGLSHIFPEGIRIGYVEERTENENHTSFDVEIRLAADMTRLSNVILIENTSYNEISELENSERLKTL